MFISSLKKLCVIFFQNRLENGLASKVEHIQSFYQKEKALVTSPFIHLGGELDAKLLSAVFRRLNISPGGGTVLDIGCGSGALSTYFGEETRYFGIDLVCQPGLKRREGKNKHFTLGNAESLPLKEQSIDLLICLDSFEHYIEPYKAAAEFFRVLKPGGTLFLSIPNYANIAGLVKKGCERFGSYARDTWAPFDGWKPEALEHFITPARIKKVFSKAGFTSFAKAGYKEEVIVGLFPWIWHPAFPERLKVALWHLNRLLARPMVVLWPSSSLHLFWKIFKL
ncbi:methyltransferase domain-containing protein [candidate division KSB1 bacterium]|nr:methyltransferase domain-containing protein [candidate division KSB1 bacterium]